MKFNPAFILVREIEKRYIDKKNGTSTIDMHRVKRQLLRRLVAPLLRGRHAPDYTARGAAVGLFVAFTPTVGVQMPLVLLLWIVARFLWPTKEFNLLVAIAWTWLTNVMTMTPVYYVFLVTGRIILGRWERLSSFDVFHEKLNASLAPDDSLLETLWVTMEQLFEQFGLPMWVGSIPWALLSAWLGYHWSLRLVIGIRARRAARRSADIKPSSGT